MQFSQNRIKEVFTENILYKVHFVCDKSVDARADCREPT